MTRVKQCKCGQCVYFSVREIKEQIAYSIDNSIIKECPVCNSQIELNLSNPQKIAILNY